MANHRTDAPLCVLIGCGRAASPAWGPPTATGRWPARGKRRAARSQGGAACVWNAAGGPRAGAPRPAETWRRPPWRRCCWGRRKGTSGSVSRTCCCCRRGNSAFRAFCFQSGQEKVSHTRSFLVSSLLPSILPPSGCLCLSICEKWGRRGGAGPGVSRCTHHQVSDHACTLRLLSTPFLAWERCNPGSGEAQGSQRLVQDDTRVRGGARIPSEAPFGPAVPQQGSSSKTLEIFLLVGVNQVNDSRFTFQRAETLFCHKFSIQV